MPGGYTIKRVLNGGLSVTQLRVLKFTTKILFYYFFLHWLPLINLFFTKSFDVPWINSCVGEQSLEEANAFPLFPVQENEEGLGGASEIVRQWLTACVL